jgi:hypothetical protein
LSYPFSPLILKLLILGLRSRFSVSFGFVSEKYSEKLHHFSAAFPAPFSPRARYAQGKMVGHPVRFLNRATWLRAILQRSAKSHNPE